MSAVLAHGVDLLQIGMMYGIEQRANVNGKKRVKCQWEDQAAPLGWVEPLMLRGGLACSYPQAG